MYMTKLWSLMYYLDWTAALASSIPWLSVDDQFGFQYFHWPSWIDAVTEMFGIRSIDVSALIHTIDHCYMQNKWIRKLQQCISFLRSFLCLAFDEGAQLSADSRCSCKDTHTHEHTHAAVPGVFLSSTHTLSSLLSPAGLTQRLSPLSSSGCQSNMDAGSDSTSLLPSHGLEPAPLAEQSPAARVWNEPSSLSGLTAEAGTATAAKRAGERRGEDKHPAPESPAGQNKLTASACSV